MRQRASVLVGELASFFEPCCGGTPGWSYQRPSRGFQAAELMGGRLRDEQVYRVIDCCLEADYHIARKASLALALETLMSGVAAELNECEVG